MAAYATLADLQELIAQFTLTTESTPTSGQAAAIIQDISNEIDVALSASGVSVPVSTPTFFRDWLGRLNAYGAAAAVLKSMFPDATGPGDTPAYAFWDEWYQRGIAGIRDGTLVPGDLPTGGSFVLPSTYLTNNPDTELDLGAIAEPMFKIGKVY